ncbi:MAG: TPM domain-containing protein [Bacteroidetes bacterium]|nr:TPM domain-containing protein [Bacteroidota bacterium]
MAKAIRILLLSLFAFFATGLTTFADDSDFPARPNTIVSDFTGTLSPDELQALERKLVAFDDSTSTQIAVVIILSVGNYDISDYTVQLFNRWKIGAEGKNNGALLLIAKEDRKLWITSGYGLEGALTDAMCKRVIENDITPRFKAGDFYGGVDAGTTSIMQIVKGEYKAGRKRSKDVGIFPFILFIFIAIIIFFAQFRRVSNYGRMNGLGFWAAWTLLNAASRRSRGSWGGFSGGSGWGGGSGGGGGFGGFGGGMSGGGGAGGSW